MANPPKYVKIVDNDSGYTAELRWTGVTYHRDAGVWDVACFEQDGRWFINAAKHKHASHLHGIELIPITKEEWG
jgi:hypothetical protein